MNDNEDIPPPQVNVYLVPLGVWCGIARQSGNCGMTGLASFIGVPPSSTQYYTSIAKKKRRDS
jgi:hypothetical protein